MRTANSAFVSLPRMRLIIRERAAGVTMSMKLVSLHPRALQASNSATTAEAPLPPSSNTCLRFCEPNFPATPKTAGSQFLAAQCSDSQWNRSLDGDTENPTIRHASAVLPRETNAAALSIGALLIFIVKMARRTR
ncbi:hypothetical protein [Mesorhizobium sp.]|uniref:hypothetical protein n=1 Tax=Mesorhizobium sp. TaxID=1871066 RepID=UPI00257AAAD3|nr:hypothetical protein [Mesorhizobium sp.]